jgi:hypothetical protein
MFSEEDVKESNFDTETKNDIFEECSKYVKLF